MCYSNCPYEREYIGSCGQIKMQNTPFAHCWNGETGEEEREEEDE